MISIVIPTYEMNGIGTYFLEQSFNFLIKQSFKNFQVVVSDHSIGDEIKNLCEIYNSLTIKYIKNENNRGNSSANLNNAILNSDFNIIKFLMQDEYIYDENCLLKIVKVFEDKKINWVAMGCLFGEDYNNPKGKMIPYYDEKIINGYNTIGSPSCISIRKTSEIEYFDTNLIWMMDCDYYKRLYNKWGLPFIINNYLIFVNQHKNQLTNLIKEEQKQLENKYVIKKYE